MSRKCSYPGCPTETYIYSDRSNCRRHERESHERERSGGRDSSRREQRQSRERKREGDRRVVHVTVTEPPASPPPEKQARCDTPSREIRGRKRDVARHGTSRRRHDSTGTKHNRHRSPKHNRRTVVEEDCEIQEIAPTTHKTSTSKHQTEVNHKESPREEPSSSKQAAPEMIVKVTSVEDETLDEDIQQPAQEQKDRPTVGWKTAIKMGSKPPPGYSAQESTDGDSTSAASTPQHISAPVDVPTTGPVTLMPILMARERATGNWLEVDNIRYIS